MSLHGVDTVVQLAQLERVDAVADERPPYPVVENEVAARGDHRLALDGHPELSDRRIAEERIVGSHVPRQGGRLLHPGTTRRASGRLVAASAAACPLAREAPWVVRPRLPGPGSGPLHMRAGVYQGWVTRRWPASSALPAAAHTSQSTRRPVRLARREGGHHPRLRRGDRRLGPGGRHLVLELGRAMAALAGLLALSGKSLRLELSMVALAATSVLTAAGLAPDRSRRPTLMDHEPQEQPQEQPSTTQPEAPPFDPDLDWCVSGARGEARRRGAVPLRAREAGRRAGGPAGRRAGPQPHPAACWARSGVLVGSSAYRGRSSA